MWPANSLRCPEFRSSAPCQAVRFPRLYLGLSYTRPPWPCEQKWSQGSYRRTEPELVHWLLTNKFLVIDNLPTCWLLLACRGCIRMDVYGDNEKSLPSVRQCEDGNSAPDASSDEITNCLSEQLKITK